VAAAPEVKPAEAGPPQAEVKPAEAPAAPPVQTAAALTPQAVQRPASATRAPILDCDRLAAFPENSDNAAPGVEFSKRAIRSP